MRLLIIECENGDETVTSVIPINEKMYNEVLPIIKIVATKQFSRDWLFNNWNSDESLHNTKLSPFYVYKDSLTPEQIKYFDSILPYSEYGIQRIVRIDLVEHIEQLL